MDDRPSRNAFGDLIVSPAKLPREGRIDVLRLLAGRLQADSSVETRWLGERLGTWLATGGDLDVVLGVRPPRGSRATAQARVRQAEADGLLLRLAALAGGDQAALAILAGQSPCPGSAQEIVARLQALGVATSPAAICRARRRQSLHGE